jgi:hypothetical protein
MFGKFVLLLLVLSVPGCATPVRTCVLRKVGDVCIIKDACSQTTITRLEGGVGIAHWTHEGPGRGRRTVLDAQMMVGGWLLGDYFGGIDEAPVQFSFALGPTNVEYHIYRRSRLPFGGNTVYSADYDGDGIPDCRYIGSGTNITYTHGWEETEGP